MNLREHIEDLLDRDTPQEYRAIASEPALAQALASAPGKTLLLHGAPGTGKTAQAWAMFRDLRRAELVKGYRCDVHPDLFDAACKRRPDSTDYDDGRQVTIIGGLEVAGLKSLLPKAPLNKVAKLITEPGDILRHRYDREWLDVCASFPGVLFVDDVGCVPSSDWVVESLYHLANARRAWGRPTVYSTNWSPIELASKFTPAIASRLCGGTVIEITGDDRRASA